jgi:hypothetical protein
LTRTPEAIPFGVYLSLFAQMFRSGVVRGIAMSALYVFAELAVIAGYLVQASAPREIRNTK